MALWRRQHLETEGRSRMSRRVSNLKIPSLKSDPWASVKLVAGVWDVEDRHFLFILSPRMSYVGPLPPIDIALLPTVMLDPFFLGECH